MKLGLFIPGRLSSKRLPNKLILPLGDSCLWDMACSKLNNLPDEYNKYVLCCDKELIDIANKYPNIKILIRDEATANAEGPLKYIFKELKVVQDTHLMFLNPCLSFLSLETIQRVLVEFEGNNMNYATSVKRYQNWLFDDSKNMKKKECAAITHINYKRLTTKEIPIYYEAAHCFHIFNKENFFEDGMMLKPGHDIISVPKEETIDIDTIQDYEFAKWKHSRK